MNYREFLCPIGETIPECRFNFVGQFAGIKFRLVLGNEPDQVGNEFVMTVPPFFQILERKRKEIDTL